MVIAMWFRSFPSHCPYTKMSRKAAIKTFLKSIDKGRSLFADAAETLLQSLDEDGPPSSATPTKSRGKNGRNCCH